MTNGKLLFRGIRSSRFRHVYGCAAKKEKCYENIAVTKNAHDSNYCCVNPKFVAIVTEVAGGGCFLVLPIERTGRVSYCAGKVTGHTGPVLDLKWNPFNDNVIASASDDCTVKLWYIPDEGLATNLEECILDLRAHRRRVSYLEWHPTAEDVLFSAGCDFQIIVWDVHRGVIISTINNHPDIIYSMSFNRNGSRLATTCKDKFIRVFNAWSGELLEEGKCHEGAKACKVTYLGDTGRLLTTGFSKLSDRQYGIWNEKDLSEPLRLDSIDSDSGVLFPFYDPDTRIVYLAGKGDGNIRYYEVTSESPWIHYLNQFLSGCPQRGLGVMPKRGLDFQQCEIFRFYKLHAIKGMCEPISMIVPRKSDQFQCDLFPDTPGPVPSMTVEEWTAGKIKDPLLISLKSGVRVSTNRPPIHRPIEAKLFSAENKNIQKWNFVTTETRADYRPFDQVSDKRQKLSYNDHNNLLIQRYSSQPNGIALNDTLPLKELRNRITSRDCDIDKLDIMELKKAYHQKCTEVRLLQNQVIAKDRKIADLESQLKRISSQSLSKLL